MSVDFSPLRRLEDPDLVAEALGLLLYGSKGPRFQEFRRSFIEGLEIVETGHWIEARGSGPQSTGHNLAAVFKEKRYNR